LLWTVKPADPLNPIKPSGIRRFSALAQETPGCINLTIGEPDFCPPKHTGQAGWQAVSEGKTHYAPTNRIPDLRAGLAQKAYCDCGLSYDPNSELLVTAGGTEAIFVALLCLRTMTSNHLVMM
jgi:aspartate/methionine/tyrosine aminotransferase